MVGVQNLVIVRPTSLGSQQLPPLQVQRTEILQLMTIVQPVQPTHVQSRRKVHQERTRNQQTPSLRLQQRVATHQSCRQRTADQSKFHQLVPHPQVNHVRALNVHVQRAGSKVSGGKV